MHERDAVGGLTEAQSRLPRFPDSATPDGPRIRDLATRAVAVLALTATAVYLGWRAVATIDLAVWWLSIPLLSWSFTQRSGLVCTPFPSGTCMPGPTRGRYAKVPCG